MTSAAAGPTKPAVGVTVARPAMAPVTVPSAFGLPSSRHSMSSHASPPAAAAMWVTVIAMAASAFAPMALPPLKPSHPTQSIAAPATVSGRLWGGASASGKPGRRPIASATTSAAVPALVCTTSPPA